MSISTDYDYKRYALYNSMVASANGQQKMQDNKLSEDTNSSGKSVQPLENSAQNLSARKSKSPLQGLVDSGTITTEQEKAIKDTLEASRLAYQTQTGAASASAANVNPLDSLVSNGTITQEQATAVKSVFESDKNVNRMPPPPPPPSEDGENSISGILDSLMSEDEITSEQKETILNILQSAFQSSQSQTNVSADTEDNTIAAGTGSNLKSSFATALAAYENQSYSFDNAFWNNFSTNF
ncbi:MAG: hypothetical protein K0R50_1714 [Eubacterium sp.]|jgi:polyhydroxyalkanoate synthesis regulator phasin|nr:hypothetical protein [Eubacterium sp.]